MMTDPLVGQTWFHKRTGKDYTIMRVCEENEDFLMKSANEGNWSSAIMYSREGMTFVRSVDDFVEKFEQVP
jgi:hypothetical protein